MRPGPRLSVGPASGPTPWGYTLSALKICVCLPFKSLRTKTSVLSLSSNLKLLKWQMNIVGPLVLMGGQADVQACAEMDTRTPIGASKFFKTIKSSDRREKNFLFTTPIFMLVNVYLDQGYQHFLRSPLCSQGKWSIININWALCLKISARADGGPWSPSAHAWRVRSSPNQHERKFSGAHVCRVTFKYQPLRSHILSFGTLGQLFEIPPFSAQKLHSARGRGVPE